MARNQGNRLEKGETVVSDIFLHGGKEPVYVFSILAPAERDGSFQGVLRLSETRICFCGPSESRSTIMRDNMLLKGAAVRLILDGSDYGGGTLQPV